MDFKILGTFQVADGMADVTPSAPKLRTVLALMVLRCGQVVRAESLIDELWGEAPPPSALTTLQTYIYQLRKTLPNAGDLAARNPNPRGRNRSLYYAESSCWLQTKPYGYIAHVPRERVDLFRFNQFEQEGRLLLEQNNPRKAVVAFRNALTLWRGPFAADVARGQNLDAYGVRIAEDRLQVLERRIDAELQLGWHRELVAELKGLVAEHPLAEGFHVRLMLALYRSDRRFEALEAYQHLRRELVTELGLEPSPPVRRLHQAMLTADPALERERQVFRSPELAVRPNDTPASGKVPQERHPLELTDGPPTGPDAPPAPAGPVQAGPVRPTAVQVSPVHGSPAQLPPDIADFVGRERELILISEQLVRDERGSSAPRIVCVSGMPGVGKTSFAIRVAHQARPRFPDGQLYAELSGRRAVSVEPTEVLGGFLLALLGHPAKIPASLEEREKLFRTFTADRSLLVVLDDAESAAQVQQLLSASSRSAVIVTCRTPLPHLPGATHIELESFGISDGVKLLARILPSDRVASERPAAECIVARCGGLPLAIRAAGARMSGARHWLLADLRDRLEDEQSRLTELRYGGLDVAAGLARSYKKLDEPIRRVFVNLGRSKWPEFTTSQVVDLLDTDPPTADSMLFELVHSGLLEVRRREAAGEIRYGFHPLTYLFARLHTGDLDREMARSDAGRLPADVAGRAPA